MVRSTRGAGRLCDCHKFGRVHAMADRDLHRPEWRAAEGIEVKSDRDEGGSSPGFPGTQATSHSYCLPATPTGWPSNLIAKSTCGSKCDSTRCRILAPWCNVSERSARFRARRRHEPATIIGRQRSQRRNSHGLSTPRDDSGVCTASRPGFGHVERSRGSGFRCRGELDRPDMTPFPNPPFPRSRTKTSSRPSFRPTSLVLGLECCYPTRPRNRIRPICEFST
jgi:hypothetical protein